MDWIWMGLDLAAIAAVWYDCDGAEVFTSIQLIWGVQVPILLAVPSFELWMSFDIANILLLLCAVVTTKRFLMVRIVMVGQIGLAMADYWKVDCAWQYHPGKLLALRLALNNLANLLLLAYTLPRAYRLVKENYAQRWNPASKAPTAPAPA
jgi:hypothetical protein